MWKEGEIGNKKRANSLWSDSGLLLPKLLTLSFLTDILSFSRRRVGSEQYIIPTRQAAE